MARQASRDNERGLDRATRLMERLLKFGVLNTLEKAGEREQALGDLFQAPHRLPITAGRPPASANTTGERRRVRDKNGHCSLERWPFYYGPIAYW